MPGLDVSEAFDNDFWDSFTLIRRLETVGNDGFSNIANTVTPNQWGVITMASPNDLQRLPEADIALKSIVIVTQVRLQLASANPGNGPTTKADVVQWAGDNYQVTLVEDYSRFGEGFIWAMAQATDYQIAAPTPNPVP